MRFTKNFRVITLELLNINKSIDLPLQPAVQEELSYQLQMMKRKDRGGVGISVEDGIKIRAEQSLPKGTVVMNGNDLAYMDNNKRLVQRGGTAER